MIDLIPVQAQLLIMSNNHQDAYVLVQKKTRIAKNIYGPQSEQYATQLEDEINFTMHLMPNLDVLDKCNELLEVQKVLKEGKIECAEI